MKRLVRTLPAMDVDEVDVIPFRFGPALNPGESISGTPEVTCEAHNGADAQAAETLQGSAVLDGTDALQRISARLAKVTYLLRCKVIVAPSGRELVAAAYLPVRRLGME